jgi:hypothetical protein
MYLYLGYLSSSVNCRLLSVQFHLTTLGSHFGGASRESLLFASGSGEKGRIYPPS